MPFIINAVAPPVGGKRGCSSGGWQSSAPNFECPAALGDLSGTSRGCFPHHSDTSSPRGCQCSHPYSRLTLLLFPRNTLVLRGEPPATQNHWERFLSSVVLLSQHINIKMRGASAGQGNISKAVIFFFICLHFCNIWVQSRAQACPGFYISIFTSINKSILPVGDPWGNSDTLIDSSSGCHQFVVCISVTNSSKGFYWILS